MMTKVTVKLALKVIPKTQADEEEETTDNIMQSVFGRENEAD